MTTVALSAPKARRRLRLPTRGEWRQNLTGYLFFAPWLLGLVLFNVYPIGAAVYYSFTEYSVLQAPRWIGLGNYHEMFFVDELFWKAIYNTFYYAAFSVPLPQARRRPSSADPFGASVSPERRSSVYDLRDH